MKDMTISIELANAILNYLATRPYGEVFQLIQAVQAAAPKDAEPAAE
jgi:hypothetical protein|tara:strand:- start:946 stop:1086 length:141 start_codon:yes stop_codon:yes gene_type:complete